MTWRRKIGLLTMVGLAGTLAWRFWPHERLLLQQATRVSTLRPITSPRIGRLQYTVHTPILWRSAREAIGFNVGRHSEFQAFSIDALTGAQAPMKKFNQAFGFALKGETNAFHIDMSPSSQFGTPWIGHLLVTCALSPDGKWLLWGAPRSMRLGDHPEMRQALALDGSHRCAWTASAAFSDFHWLPDSRHWVEWVEEKSKVVFFIHSMNPSSRTRTLSVALPSSYHMYDITPTGYVLARDYNWFFRIAGILPSAINSWQFAQCDLDLLHTPSGRVAAVPTHAFRVHLPPGLHVELVDPFPVLSPQGDRLAWLAAREYAPPNSPWLRRIWTFFGQHRQTLIGLWVSRLDGNQMQEIGHLAYRPKEEVPQDIRWTPDGKRLSFLYKGGLYTVPADAS